jgi:hypothetical protein
MWFCKNIGHLLRQRTLLNVISCLHLYTSSSHKPFLVSFIHLSLCIYVKVFIYIPRIEKVKMNASFLPLGARAQGELWPPE